MAISTPVAGVVGFAIQLRNVKRLRLENEKLGLEIRVLEENLKKANARIIVPSTAEVRELARAPMASRRGDQAVFSRGNDQLEWRKRTRLSLGEVALLVGAAVVVAYLVYDIYRLLAWIVTRFSS